MARDGCPPVGALRTLLAGDSTIDLGSSIIRHVADCDRCRIALEAGWDDSKIKLWRTLLTRPAGPDDLGATLRDSAEEASSHEPVLPHVEGYELLKQIGRGGSGVVYRARQIELDRLVALKMLSFNLTAPQRAAARMKQESLVIARLRHPHVVTIHDVGEQDGIPYLCLELVEGGSLADRIAGKPVSHADAAHLIVSLARTIQDIHDAGIIHRDLKPANILLEGDLGIPLDRCFPKVTDFGLSKSLETESPFIHTKTGEILGTPSYMAPEQLSAGQNGAGKSVDIYGLGAILFELLTGRPPYLGETPLETAVQIITKPTPRPKRLNPLVPAALDLICTRCLSKRPRFRYPSAEALARDLEAFLTTGSGPSTYTCFQAVRPRISTPLVGGVGIAAVVIVCGLFALMFQPTTTKRSPEPAAVIRSVKVLPPASRVAQVGQDYLAEARVEVVGAGPMMIGQSATYTFDLQDSDLPAQERFLDRTLTRNARLWDEPRHDIRYWGPIDPNEWFEVTYRFPFDFPIASARLNAKIDLFEDSLCSLEVSPDPSRGWSVLMSGDHRAAYAGEHNLDQYVRGSRVLYIRARMKGRDDGQQSCFAQFLRTSTSSQEYTALKGSSVFHIRASDRHIPRIDCQVSSNEGKQWKRVRVADDGTARIVLKWPEAGLKRIQIRASVDDGAWNEASSEVLVVDQGSLVEIDPFLKEVETGSPYRAIGRFRGRSSPSSSQSGSVDFGDGTAVSSFSIDHDGSFSLNHTYQNEGKYKLTIMIHGTDGSFTGTLGFCLVKTSRTGFGSRVTIPADRALPGSRP